MRRAVLAVIGTVAGTALMVGAKLGTPRPDDPAAATATDDGPVSSAPPGPAPASAPPAAATASAGPPAPGQSPGRPAPARAGRDRKSTRLNSSHMSISYA